MDGARPLRGSCSCGRNQYLIAIPETATHQAQIFFDNSSTTRHLQAAPLTAWLRVPLGWYRSTTHAYFPDETHSSIRRTYHLPLTTHTRRQFCGYCGTQLSSWDEESREDAEFISLTLGSLLDDDLHELETLGLLPAQGSEEDGVALVVQEPGTTATSALTRQEIRQRGVPWFEEMVEDSGLGRVRRQKGGHSSRDGKTTVEWEIVEVESGMYEESGLGKRKLGQVEGVAGELAGGDVAMRGAL